MIPCYLYPLLSPWICDRLLTLLCYQSSWERKNDDNQNDGASNSLTLIDSYPSRFIKEFLQLSSNECQHLLEVSRSTGVDILMVRLVLKILVPFLLQWNGYSNGLNDHQRMMLNGWDQRRTEQLKALVVVSGSKKQIRLTELVQLDSISLLFYDMLESQRSESH